MIRFKIVLKRHALKTRRYIFNKQTDVILRNDNQRWTFRFLRRIIFRRRRGPHKRARGFERLFVSSARIRKSRRDGNSTDSTRDTKCLITTT